MTGSRIAPRGFLVLLWLSLMLPAAAGQAGSGEAKDDVLGGKLLVKLPYEVYRPPLFFDCSKGPRLGVWVHESNPAPAFGFPGAPAPKNGVQPSGPPFDLTIWDIAAGKELYHLKDKDNPPPYPRGGVMRFRAREPIHRMNYSPSGKNLVYLEPAPTGLNIKLYEPQTHKRRTLLVSTGKGASVGVPQGLFAPNGDLVILDNLQCVVQEIGKARPRRVFQLTRPGLTVTPTGIPLGFAVGFADAAISPKGETLAVSADGVVLMFDLKKGQFIWYLPKLSVAPGVFAARLQASLAFLPAAGETKLLAVETVPDPDKGTFVMLARYVDVKAKTELARAVLLEAAIKKPAAVGMPGGRPPQWGQPHCYFNTKGEPRVIADGKLFDAATGKVLYKTEGHRYVVSRDGQYAVRLTPVSPLDKTKMSVELWSVDRSR